MKITAFNPVIVSSQGGEILELFNELGFEKRHTLVVDKKDGSSVTRYRMKDQNGFYMDISDAASVQSDMTFIRMNVDDFDEAHALLTSMGFTTAPGAEVITLKRSKILRMASPSGFQIELIKHIKD
jgi:hypothetical protein